MDSFEINKIIAAVLLVALIIIGIGKISDIASYTEAGSNLQNRNR